jgi:hypothetical protein
MIESEIEEVERPIMTFSELIQSEEEVLKRVLLASQRQVEIVELGNPGVLIDCLGQRERLWQEFVLLEKQLESHKGIPPERRVWKNAEERQLTEAALKRCEALLAEILANDQISLTKAGELKDEKEKDLRRIQQGKKAARGYME